MCGRFNAPHLTHAEMVTIIREFLDAAKKSHIDTEAPGAFDSYNVKPTQQVQIQYLEGDTLVSSTARWWFVPHWHKGEVKDWKATTFNARIEEAREKPTFRTAWKKGRCIIPAAGYYEWTGKKGKKQPWFITLDTNQPIQFFAGLWSVLPDGTKTCTILTRASAPQLGEVHHRMPVILEPHHIEPWLSGNVSDEEVLDTFGAGWEGRFKVHKVKPFAISDDGPGLLISSDETPGADD